MAGLLALALASCSSEEPETGPPLPSGVTPSAWGDVAEMGETLPIVLANAAGGTAGALVHLTAEKPAVVTADDLRLFAGIPDAATVFRVMIAMQNRGPDTVDMTAEPGWFVRVDDIFVPPTTVSGQLDGCEQLPRPDELATGAAFATCLVFIVEDGLQAGSVDYLSHDRTQTVSWTLPDLADVS